MVSFNSKGYAEVFFPLKQFFSFYIPIPGEVCFLGKKKRTTATFLFHISTMYYSDDLTMNCYVDSNFLSIISMQFISNLRSNLGNNIIY